MIFHPPGFWKDRKILFGVSGGIAAYKSANIVSALVRGGADVRIVMTRNATKLIGRSTFQALSGNQVLYRLFGEGGEIQHIRAVRESDCIVVAPATANLLGKMAGGIADDLLSTLLLVDEKKVILAPAMNTGMWESSAVQENILRLHGRGVRIIEPGEGWLACRETGKGRMLDLEPFLEELYCILHRPRPLEGKKALVISGPTREWWDPVRFLSNPSTGSMGSAFAQTLRAHGADVQMISGPAAERKPTGVSVTEIETAKEMADAAERIFPWCDICIMAAAVSDYRPASFSVKKMKKGKEEEIMLTLTVNPDILAFLGSQKEGRTVVGFCAETEGDVLLAEGRRKLVEKNIDCMVANLVGEKGKGFGKVPVHGVLMDRLGHQIPIENLDKFSVAETVISHLTTYFK